MNSSKNNRDQKTRLSEWILDYDKNAYCDNKINNESREVLIDSFNECSDLRKSFHDSLQNFFNNFGFSASMRNIHNLDNSFTSFDNAFQEKRKTFGYIGDFGLVKNNSYTKLGKKKKKIFNEMKKPITSIRKKMLPKGGFDDDDDFEEEENKKREKMEKDKNDLDIINQMVYGDIGQKEIFNEEIIESENEDSEEKKN